MSKGIKVVFTRHAVQRIRERGATVEEVRRLVLLAAPFAPRWPRAAAAISCPSLPVDPVVKYLSSSNKAIVTTALPPGVPLKPKTEVMYVI